MNREDFFWKKVSFAPMEEVQTKACIDSFSGYIDVIAKNTLTASNYALHEQTDLRLGVVQLEDLGQEEPIFYHEVMALLQEKGFRLLSAVLVPHIFMRCHKILKKERLHVAMSPIVSTNSCVGNFYLGHDSLVGKLCFYKHPVGEDSEKRGKWSPSEKFLVILPE